MTQEESKNYELHLNALKKWNDQRGIEEKKALEKFYNLKQTFTNQSLTNK